MSEDSAAGSPVNGWVNAPLSPTPAPDQSAPSIAPVPETAPEAAAAPPKTPSVIASSPTSAEIEVYGGHGMSDEDVDKLFGGRPETEPVALLLKTRNAAALTARTDAPTAESVRRAAAGLYCGDGTPVKETE